MKCLYFYNYKYLINASFTLKAWSYVILISHVGLNDCFRFCEWVNKANNVDDMKLNGFVLSFLHMSHFYGCFVIIIIKCSIFFKTTSLKTFFGWKHIKPPKNCSHKNNFLTLSLFWQTSHLEFFFLLKIYLIRSRLRLIISLKKFNKNSKSWTYGIYMGWNHTHQKIFQNQGC
jgi:hypothetical protein